MKRVRTNEFLFTIKNRLNTRILNEKDRNEKADTIELNRQFRFQNITIRTFRRIEQQIFTHDKKPIKYKNIKQKRPVTLHKYVNVSIAGNKVLLGVCCNWKGIILIGKLSVPYYVPFVFVSIQSQALYLYVAVV